MAHPHELETLLKRIRDAQASADELARARELLRVDERFPEELRADALDDEPEAAAVALLALLGIDDTFAEDLVRALHEEALDLSSAVMFEIAAGPVHADWTEDDEADWAPLGAALREGLEAFGSTREADVASDVLATIAATLPVADAVRLELGWELPIAEAVRTEAGRVDVVVAVLAAAGLEEPVVPTAEAVRALAGDVDVVEPVFEMLATEAIGVALRETILAQAGTVDVADAVLARIGEAPAPVAEAVRALAGSVDVADAVLARLGLSDPGIPVAEAVRALAGDVDVTPELDQVFSDAWLSAMLDHELLPAAHRLAAERVRAHTALTSDMTAFAEVGRQLRSAVAAEAGDPPAVWAGVATAIGVSDADAVPGYDGRAVAEAVRAEAGRVDVAPEVMRRIRTERMRSLPEAGVEPLVAANRGFTVGAVVLAAVALFVVFLGRSYTGSPVVARIDTEAPAAQASELTVNDLKVDDSADVHLIESDGDDGSVVIWVDEGTKP